MATLGIPGHGYGIRYEFGIFAQRIENGQQIEAPDNWLRYGCPWEIPRPDHLFPVRFGGKVQRYVDGGGKLRHEWAEAELVMAVAQDILIPGYGNRTVNSLRLWAAKSSRDFNLDYFNHGDYVRAVEDKNRTENISKVLYPKDDRPEGRELRLKQEYFLVSATLQDILRRHRKRHDTLHSLPEKAAIQMNDTHPALAVAELMRILIDRENFGWEEAWDITVNTCAYTNHTIRPEALERIPVPLLQRVLPRHIEIIWEINRRLLEEVARRWPGDTERLRRLSLIE
jgi:starch phosphorylase